MNDILKHDYVYRSTFVDIIDQQSLYDSTLDFLRKEGLEHTFPALEAELRKIHFLIDGQYSGLAPYNNFHVASRRFWQNPIVQRYIQHIENEKGILKYGWMDANIHGMVIYILARYCGMKVRHVGWFGYRHNLHVSRLGHTGVEFVETLPFGLTNAVPTF